MDLVSLRTCARYDVVSNEYMSTSMFPCVRHNREGATLFKLYYSGYPLEGVQYRRCPLGERGKAWNIQNCLFDDGETKIAVCAALQMCGAAPGSYLSTNFPDGEVRLKGCSLGLAVFACVLGLPPGIAYTGFVSAFGVDQGHEIGPVNGTGKKVRYCAENKIPIVLSASVLTGDPDTTRASGLGKFYCFEDWTRGKPYECGTGMAEYMAIEVRNVAEMIIIVQSIAAQRKVNEEEAVLHGRRR